MITTSDHQNDHNNDTVGCRMWTNARHSHNVVMGYLDVERAHRRPVHAVEELQTDISVTRVEFFSQEPGCLSGVATGLCVHVVTCSRHAVT